MEPLISERWSTRGSATGHGTSVPTATTADHSPRSTTGVRLRNSGFFFGIPPREETSFRIKFFSRLSRLLTIQLASRYSFCALTREGGMWRSPSYTHDQPLSSSLIANGTSSLVDTMYERCRISSKNYSAWSYPIYSGLCSSLKSCPSAVTVSGQLPVPWN
jgi:hypothetical protein